MYIRKIILQLIVPSILFYQLLKLLSTQAQAKYLLRSHQREDEGEKSNSVKKAEVKKRGLVSYTSPL